MNWDLPMLGALFAIVGSLTSIIGACLNNLYHNHKAAMQCWMISNILLLVWAAGYTAGMWDGGLSGVALIGMYLVFTVTNAYGLVKYRV